MSSENCDFNAADLRESMGKYAIHGVILPTSQFHTGDTRDEYAISEISTRVVTRILGV